MFKKAVKSQSRARVAIAGPSGSGKTFTALRIAEGLARHATIAVIDTERGSAAKYADETSFDVCELQTFSPRSYVEAIKAAEAAGYSVLVIDSLSHAWIGAGGALEMVDKASARSKSGNSFGAWREVTPEHNALVEAILQCRMHVIVTMRSKTEYVLETGSNGKQVPRKIGMAPVQRDGLEYEFDLFLDMDAGHTATVTKSRCKELADGVFRLPGVELGYSIADWLSDGAPPAPETPKPSAEPKSDRPPVLGEDAVRMIESLDTATIDDLAGLREVIRGAWGMFTKVERAAVQAAFKRAESKGEEGT